MYELNLRINYFIRNILGYCRGLFINLTGKIKYENSNDQTQNFKANRERGIVINDKVWIGEIITVLIGVTIGGSSVIGAHSCVVSDIPTNSIAVGNLAKIVKRGTTWQR